MIEKRVVVTGANSYLGRSLVHQLSLNPRLRIPAFVSPRADTTKLISPDNRISYVQSDLIVELSKDAQDELARADAVVHLAWQRGTGIDDVVQTNKTMISNLLHHFRMPSQFLFVSSAAASEFAPSTYGIAKSRAENYVIDNGGKVIVCGLVVDNDNPGTAYQTIHNLICNTPFDIRFYGTQPLVYIISLTDFLAVLDRYMREADWPLVTGFYMPGGIRLQKLLQIIKDLCPRTRILVPMHASLVRGIARVLHFSPWKELGEKLLTFFFDNRSRLNELETLASSDLETTRLFLSDRRRID